MVPRRRRSSLVLGAVVLAASGAACSAVLGLDAPTLAPCANGCPDASLPMTDAGGDSTVPGDAPFDTGGGPDVTPDAIADAIVDVAPDRGPSTGVRCGGGSSAVYCAPPSGLCCLEYDDAGSTAYSCVAGSTSDASACPGYPIACASDNDCPGSDICCFYHSGVKCEPLNTASCTSLVCDPSAPASAGECNTGQTCSVAYLFDGGSLPYFGCN